MTTTTNVQPSAHQNKTSTKGEDLSQAILQEIFGSKEDFKAGVIKDITPKIAAKLLERNLINRTLRQRHVDWLASQMTSGYWKFTGDAIKMNRDGVLVDKQHTLSAIIQSGTTQRFVVIGGLDDTIIEVIDTGIARTAGDVLKMNNIQNANSVAALCRRILAFKNRQKASAFSRRAKGGKEVNTNEKDKEDFISNSRIFEEITADSRYSDACHTALKFYDSSRILSPSQYGLLYFLFSEKNPDAAWEFLSKFSNGVGLQADSPIYALRSRLSRERETKVRFSDSLKLYWFFTCWNKFRRGETVGNLVTPARIEIPELI